MAEKYVPIFYDWIEATRELNAQEKGRLVDALVMYARGGDWQEQIKGNERYSFPMFQLQFDRFRAVAEQRATNRSKPEQNEQNGTNADKKNKREQKEQNGTKSRTSTYTSTSTDSNTNTNTDSNTNTNTNNNNYDDSSCSAYAVENLLNLSSGNLEELASFIADLPSELIRYAVDTACSAGKPYWNYCRAILRAYVERGFKTIAEVKAAEAAHKRGQATQQTEYADEEDFY